MTKQEFFATLMNNQVMPLATIDVMHEGRSMYSLYVRQRNAPNCTLSRHCDGSKTGQDMHGKYLDWMHEYTVKFDELVDAAHAEALAINETLDIIADDQAEAATVVNAIDMDVAVGIAHAEALEENKRFDNLLARFVQFKRWYPSVQRNLIAVAHADALELDKAYDEANAEPDAMPLRWVQSCGRAMRLPNCRCAMAHPVFEPVILDLRQLYGEALRDYWPFATEEDRAELIEEHHALALVMDMHRDFYRLPLILRILAIVQDHELALRMDYQIDFYRSSPESQKGQLAQIHEHALNLNRHYDEVYRAIGASIATMPAFIRMTFELK